LISKNKVSSLKVKLIRTLHLHVILGLSSHKNLGITNPQNNNEMIGMNTFNGYVYENGATYPLGIGISDGQ